MIFARPFTLQEATVRLYAADPLSGAPLSNDSAVIGECPADLRVEINRPEASPGAFGDEIGRSYQIDTDYTIALTTLWGLADAQDGSYQQGARFLTTLEPRGHYCLVARWHDQDSGDWTKLTFWHVTATAESMASTATAHNTGINLHARAAHADAGATATRALPNLQPAADGLVEYVAAGRTVPAYQYSFATANYNLLPANDAGGGVPRFLDISQTRIRILRGGDGWVDAITFANSPQQSQLLAAGQAHLAQRNTLPESVWTVGDHRIWARFVFRGHIHGEVSAYGDLAAPRGDETAGPPNTDESFILGANHITLSPRQAFIQGEIVES